MYQVKKEFKNKTVVFQKSKGQQIRVVLDKASVAKYGQDMIRKGYFMYFEDGLKHFQRLNKGSKPVKSELSTKSAEKSEKKTSVSEVTKAKAEAQEAEIKRLKAEIEELKNPKSPSSAFKVAELSAEVEKLETVEAVNEFFTEEDKRQTSIDLKAKRIAELSK